MPDRSSPRRASAAAAALAVAALFAGAAQAQPSGPLRGTIRAVTGTTLSLDLRGGGTADLALAPDTRIAAVKRIEASAIAPGAYVGVAAEPEADGTLRAQEVLVFPPAQRGTGEGQRPWNLAPGSVMTNAAIDGVVSGQAGPVMTLAWQGKTARIEVPPGTPVVTQAPAARSDLQAGRKVVAFVRPPAGGSVGGSAGGPATAATVVVEKDGIAPPM